MQSLSIDIVLCTYNRPSSCLFLIEQLLHLPIRPQHIIVIDSSEQPDERLSKQEGIRWFASNHKNQAYQRYVGFKQSHAELILYLDDDMEVEEARVLEAIQHRFQEDPSLVAMALHFKNKIEGGSLSSIPVSQINQQSFLKKIWNGLSGYPTLPSGRFGYCGNRGKQPTQGGYTEWLSGGAFVAKRSALYQNFNYQLFDLFEEKMGMGEDGLMGYTLNKQGRIYFDPTLFFWHHEQQHSHYAAQNLSYAKRVLFSRLFLSLEKARLDGSSLIYARVHYLWYGLCRLLGYLMNYIKSPNTKRKEILQGSWQGLKKGFTFSFLPIPERKQYWEQELLKLQVDKV
jgi:GT2 family glycosyltransferase